MNPPYPVQELNKIKDGKKRLAAALLECRKVRRCGTAELSDGGCNMVQVGFSPSLHQSIKQRP